VSDWQLELESLELEVSSVTTVTTDKHLISKLRRSEFEVNKCNFTGVLGLWQFMTT